MHWQKLLAHGVAISFSGGLVEVKGTLAVTATPSVADLARGILNLRNRAFEMQQWAAVVVALTEIDFALVEAHPYGNDLLEILWDIAFHKALTQEQASLIETMGGKGIGEK